MFVSYAVVSGRSCSPETQPLSTAARPSSWFTLFQVPGRIAFLIQVVGHGITKENFFKTFRQAFVDKMAGLLGK